MLQELMQGCAHALQQVREYGKFSSERNVTALHHTRDRCREQRDKATPSNNSSFCPALPSESRAPCQTQVWLLLVRGFLSTRN